MVDVNHCKYSVADVIATVADGIATCDYFMFTCMVDVTANLADTGISDHLLEQGQQLICCSAKWMKYLITCQMFLALWMTSW